MFVPELLTLASSDAGFACGNPVIDQPGDSSKDGPDHGPFAVFGDCASRACPCHRARGNEDERVFDWAADVSTRPVGRSLDHGLFAHIARSFLDAFQDLRGADHRINDRFSGVGLRR